GKRLCIVTGTHGDELEGQYVCWKLAQMLRAGPEELIGTVDIYPALNPLGINTIVRGMPLCDLDMNRMFPGSTDGSMPEYVTSLITRDLLGADVCVDIHASNIFLREIPQVRISEEMADSLLPLARTLGMDFVWLHSAATVLQSTLAHTLNTQGVKTLVVEMGVGMRITQSYGDRLVEGIFSLMHTLGMWKAPTSPVPPPIVSTDGSVAFINANASGVFLPVAEHTQRVRKGELLGVIADPLSGDVKEEIVSPRAGLLFTLRAYPVVYAGSLIARILGGNQ
ncbi:MAG: M14 family metallopeptidase, partial [Eubacteriales bacterium]|nr:M14 family metallopeptidase [Eubacteriales bacterium]